ncbi:hypothetical protein JKP88DRAFT_265213 [Tribonema minus]|uniref:PDZ domain-containing protein n=1 Tax=Tribonema minus TaxID=303371 RepID=A0A835YKE3_9STRA|nr:hypothetical protein JKP88DRAFT_265213 [Tribonema minus]
MVCRLLKLSILLLCQQQWAYAGVSSEDEIPQVYNLIVPLTEIPLGVRIGQDAQVIGFTKDRHGELPWIARKGGLLTGDRIVAIDGDQTEDMNPVEFADALTAAVAVANQKVNAASENRRSAGPAARPMLGIGGAAPGRRVGPAAAAHLPAQNEGSLVLTVRPLQHSAAGRAAGEQAGLEPNHRRLSGFYGAQSYNEALSGEASWHMDLTIGPLEVGSINVTKALFGEDPPDCESRRVVWASPGKTNVPGGVLSVLKVSGEPRLSAEFISSGDGLALNHRALDVKLPVTVLRGCISDDDAQAAVRNASGGVLVLRPDYGAETCVEEHCHAHCKCGTGILVKAAAQARALAVAIIAPPGLPLSQAVMRDVLSSACPSTEPQANVRSNNDDIPVLLLEWDEGTRLTESIGGNRTFVKLSEQPHVLRLWEEVFQLYSGAVAWPKAPKQQQRLLGRLKSLHSPSEASASGSAARWALIQRAYATAVQHQAQQPDKARTKWKREL